MPSSLRAPHVRNAIHKGLFLLREIELYSPDRFLELSRKQVCDLLFIIVDTNQQNFRWRDAFGEFLVLTDQLEKRLTACKAELCRWREGLADEE